MKTKLEYIRTELKDIYPDTEISSFIRIITEELTGEDYRLVLLENPSWEDSHSKRIKEIVERLKKHEPIQHIFGRTTFYDLILKVNGNVLIPRQETEELVDLIVRSNKKEGLKLVDIGTGSGCIAIALAKNLRNAKIDAWEYSQEAIAVAEENNRLNNAYVNILEVDIFQPYPDGKKYDIVVSNPPYVMEFEKEFLDANVIDYEPHLALFVPNDNALIFYERIADVAINILKNEGKLYFEINRAKSQEIQDMLIQKGFSDVKLYYDLNRCERMITATKPA